MNKKPILYIDLDGVIVDLIGELDIELALHKPQLEDLTDWIDLSETIFLNARPVPGALEAVAELEKHYEVFILSTAPWKTLIPGRKNEFG
jgi:5'-nucleotidase